MQKLLLFLSLLVIECQCETVKKVIIIRQINGKTVVQGLDNVESDTLKFKKNVDKSVEVTIKVEQIQHNSKATSPSDYRQF